jgi:hypothetical protein
MSGAGSRQRFAGGLILLAVRGLLLWVAVPLGVVAWPLVVVLSCRRGVRLGQFLGWLDLNLTSAIQRTICRPFFEAPMPWTPFDAAAGLTHRIRLFDPA